MPDLTMEARGSVSNSFEFCARATNGGGKKDRVYLDSAYALTYMSVILLNLK
jgi:hypothetical protein